MSSITLTATFHNSKSETFPLKNMDNRTMFIKADYEHKPLERPYSSLYKIIEISSKKNLTLE